MFDISALPRITFVTSGSEDTLDLSRCGGQIQRISDTVSQQVAPSSTVGLIFPTGPQLVIHWLGTLAAGRVPVILQYPTEKISKPYWQAALCEAITTCKISALLGSQELSRDVPDGLGHSSLIDDLEQSSASAEGLTFPQEGEILQMSSGTTGVKKAIRVSFEALRSHTALYNEVMHLGSGDCIVSWLPLSHDMGLIACFVMPLMLGIPVILIDPITWVHQPRLLFEAIRRHRGTVCYMPNFGFEVMAKSGKSEPLASVRHWISCSEPTYPATLERFIHATDADPASISTCYGMAENVFAVTQSSGMRTLTREDRRYVSCGRSIPGTEVKEVAGELFVRSPHSLQLYEGGEDIRDEAGFYATGDLGFLEDGEIVITGRKQDLANIAGQKFLLNDFDYILGQLFPQSAGRIASMTSFDSIGGTEKALFLIEDDRFWERESDPAPARLIREATGVEWMEVHFVPRYFITKTSSGKINRKKTLEHWQAYQAGVRIQRPATGSEDLARALADHFPGVVWDRPVQEQLDSLGLLILSLFCDEHGVAYVPDLTLERIVTQRERVAESAQGKVFSIVALVDSVRLGFGAPQPFIDDKLLDSIAKVVGMPVHFEHICAPPTPILFSDLIFHDYFLPRNPDPAYGPISSLLQKIKNASLLLIDDEDNFSMPGFCAYPALDRQFTMHPDAELLAHRMQRYTQNHHLLARTVVLGREIKPEIINPALTSLQAYLGTPIFRMAFTTHFRPYTEHWEFCDYREYVSLAEKLTNRAWLTRFGEVLLQFIRERAGEFRSHTGEAANRIILVDTLHFCSFVMNRAAVDFVVDRYSSFCIIGLPSSLPYLKRRLEELGKPYFFSSQLDPARKDFECLVLTGGIALKMPVTSKPTFDFMQAREEGQGGGRPHNVSPSIDELCPSFAACDQQLYRATRTRYGAHSDMLVGNYLLNHTVPSRVNQAPA